MNSQELAENLGLEYYEYLEIVELFLETSSLDLSELQAAIDEENTQKVAEAAHSIKGASGNIGFMDLFEVAKGVEMKARENSLEGISDSVQILKSKLDEIAELVRG